MSLNWRKPGSLLATQSHFCKAVRETPPPDSPLPPPRLHLGSHPCQRLCGWLGGRAIGLCQQQLRLWGLALLAGRLPQSPSAAALDAPARYECLSSSAHSISRKFGLSPCWTIAMWRNLILWWLRSFCVQWQTKETPAVQLSVMELFHNPFSCINDTVKNSLISLDGNSSLSLAVMDWN